MSDSLKPPYKPTYKPPYSLDNYLQRIETYLVREAMARNRGIVTSAGRELGIGYTTLQWRLKKLGIDPNEYRNQGLRGPGGGTLDIRDGGVGGDRPSMDKNKNGEEKKEKRLHYREPDARELALLEKVKAT